MNERLKEYEVKLLKEEERILKIREHYFIREAE